MEELYRKIGALKTFILDKAKNGAVIAFSGGVDSATLAAISHQVLGQKAVAVVVQSPLHPVSELVNAKKTAQEIGIALHIVKTEQLKNPDFIKNPVNRCYYCKKALLYNLSEFAKSHNFEAIFEGTNLTDLTTHRPGFKAIQEIKGVYSPWVDCKFTKAEIREVAKNLGLKVNGKPAFACLATRIQFNDAITIEKLERIQKAEQALRRILNSEQIRVRDHNGLARIEVDPSKRNLFCNVQVLDKVAVELKKLGFKYVTFDLEGYQSGSMLKGV